MKPKVTMYKDSNGYYVVKDYTIDQKRGHVVFRNKNLQKADEEYRKRGGK